MILSQKSLSKLNGVNPNLVNIVKKAIQITNQDFAVLEGVRTLEKQREYVARGVSKTLSSKHLIGEAVDLVAWVNGTYSWDEKYYYEIADAMREAAIENGIDLIWGGVWNKTLNYLGDLKQSVKNYVEERRLIGKSAFLDFPHFEIKRYNT